MKNVVFITGSSSGIGQATAYVFANEGWNVVVTYYDSKKDGEKTVEECLERGATSVMLIHLDLLDDKNIKDALDSIKKKYGQIDVLVNNAGVFLEKQFKKSSFTEIEKEIRTNFEGTIKMTYAALPITKQAIVNVASQVGVIPYGGASVYSATKWGVRGFTKSLAQEHPELLIIAVNPGMTATKMTSMQGIPASNVAELILGAVNGKHKIITGADLNVWEIYHQRLP
jgi:NAD(P)-dependent dehydrogenase (short-subunit alcohol dehydrogenase family)